jgi:hypothetical protein
MARKIPVGKTPGSAFNPQRKISSLLAAQVENLRHVVARKFGEVPEGRPRTEAAASLYIAKMTALLHPPPTTADATPPPAAAKPPLPAPAAAPSSAGRRKNPTRRAESAMKKSRALKKPRRISRKKRSRAPGKRR